MNPSELEKRLLQAFAEEAEERLENLLARLTELENTEAAAARSDILETVFREAHSLKGAARSVNLSAIEQLCQSMENVFGLLKSDTIAFSGRLFDSLHDAAKYVSEYIAAEESARQALQTEMQQLGRTLDAFAGQDAAEADPGQADASPPTKNEGKAEAKTDAPPAPPTEADTAVESPSAEVVFPAAADNEAAAPTESQPHGKPLAANTVRIASDKLDALLLKAEELIAFKQITAQYLSRVSSLYDILETQLQWQKKIEDDRSDLRALHEQSGQYNDLLSFVDRITETHQQTADQVKDLIRNMEHGNRTVSTMVDDLLNDVKDTTLMPFSTLLAILPRMARDIAKDQQKFVEIRISGGEIEVDKRILERIKDPVIHLIRNAIDHGIEMPEARRNCGKSEKGRITVDAVQLESNRVSLTIADDGAGFDTGAIQSKAKRAGIIREQDVENLSETDTLRLIFYSGLSTSGLISEISGRGLGMAIVKETIEDVGGRVDVSHTPGKGAVFNLELPITQATFRGILISVADQYYILPNAQVQHVVRFCPEDIFYMGNRPMLRVREQAVSLAFMDAVLGLPKAQQSGNEAYLNGPDRIYTALMLGEASHPVAFVVDAVLNEQEVLVKNLGRQLEGIAHVAGATVLGSGHVAPVLNVHELVAAAAGKDFSAAVPQPPEEEDAAKQSSVLVVEDSFTSRTLLKNILEASGYRVKTAINGEDGYQRLQSEPFDAVVSDVEMPRLNGFELTKKIRADAGIAETPVILVTSLDSRADREKGIDVGADAYIVKGSFDQSNLLAVLEQLI